MNMDWKEIKTKVFAQYLGQIITSNGKKYKMTVTETSNKNERSLFFATDNICQLILKPISDITPEDLLQVAKITCGAQYSEPFDCIAKWLDTSKDPLKILKIEFKAHQQQKHLNDKPITFIVHITTWGSISIYVDNQMGQNNKGYFIYQYLQSKGYDMNHYLLGGKTLHEAELAVYETVNAVKKVSHG